MKGDSKKPGRELIIMKIKLNRLLCILFMSLALCSSAAAQTADKHIPIDIIVNGSYIKTDADPFIEYDTTFVPIRFVSEALGADSVSWNAGSKTATIIKGGTKIVLYENKKDAYVNDKKITLSKSARIEGGRLFVPVRFISESFGASVKWDDDYYNVEISLGGEKVDSSLAHQSYTNDEIFWLARIIHAESEGEPARGKIGVGNVILNRVKSSDFPDTIYNVIFDRNHGVQFEPIMNGTIYNTPSNESIISSKRALRGENTVGSSLYFLNPRIATNNWITNNRTYYTTISNHDFYL